MSYCNHCGNQLPEGFHGIFCPSPCRAAVKRERVAAQRAKMREKVERAVARALAKRCAECTRKVPV